MKAPQTKWLVTNGDVGSFDNRIVYYSRHNNGIRALQRVIQEHADRTGRESWAELWPLDYDFRKIQHRYYVRQPQH